MYIWNSFLTFIVDIYIRRSRSWHLYLTFLFGVYIWHLHFTFTFDVCIWHLYLTFITNVYIGHLYFTFIIGIYVRHLYSTFTLDVHVWRLHFLVVHEISRAATARARDCFFGCTWDLRRLSPYCRASRRNFRNFALRVNPCMILELYE